MIGRRQTATTVRKRASVGLLAVPALIFVLAQIAISPRSAIAQMAEAFHASCISSHPCPKHRGSVRNSEAAPEGGPGLGYGAQFGRIANESELRWMIVASRGVASPAASGTRGSTGTAPRFGPADRIIPQSPGNAVPVLRQLAEVKFSPKFEENLWSVIKESTNPAEFRTYLNVFPRGKFAVEAKQRLDDLRSDKIASKPEMTAPAVEPAAEPKPILKRYEVTKNFDLLAAPDAAAEVVGQAESGEQLLVAGQVAGLDWYKVSREEGQFAYFAGKRMSELREVGAAPPSSSTQSPTKPPMAVARTSSATPPPAAVKTEAFRDCPDCPEMITITAGQFQMGSDKGDGTEKPVRTVRITKPFAIGKFEVTVAQWRACVVAKGCEHVSAFKKYRPNSPAGKLSWIDVQEYVVWLSRTTGYRYRLPTEAEWEYAARGGSQAEYWWGDEMAGDKADCKGCGGKYDRKRPQPVGGDKPNPLGLHGVSGGVWEWTADCWHKSYASAPDDGGIWDKPDCRLRVLRGGSWRNDADYARVASRFKYDFNVRYSTNGFRVARDLR